MASPRRVCSCKLQRQWRSCAQPRLIYQQKYRDGSQRAQIARRVCSCKLGGGEEGGEISGARGEKNPPPVRRRAPSAESIVSGPNPYMNRSVIYGIVRRIAPAGGARPSRGSGNGTAWGCCHSSYRAHVRARASRQPGPPACQGQPTRPNQRALGLAHPCARQLCRRLPEGTGHFLCSAPPPCGPPHEGIGERHPHDQEDSHL